MNVQTQELRAMSKANPEVGKTVRTGGFLTNYHDVGSGSPILLLHGSGPGVSAWANWRTVLTGLSDDFRLIAPDLVGFGYSDVLEDGQYSRVRWLLVDALHLDRSGGTLDDVQCLARRSPYLQICDAAGVQPTSTEALRREARENRLAPGDGALDLVGLIRLFDNETVVAVEVPSPRSIQIGAARYANELFEKSSEVLQRASVTT